MAYTVRNEEQFDELFTHKPGPKPRQPPITQIMIVETSGRCLLWIGPRGENLKEDMIASLLSALCGFSLEALGLELAEIATKQNRMFLAGTKQLIVAIVVQEDVMTEFRRIKPQIRCLMARILELVSTLEVYYGDIRPAKNHDELGFLRYEIETEIARIFPSSHLNSAEFGLDPADLPKLRILTYLWDQDTYTLAKIAKDLRMPRSKVEENLLVLAEGGFIINERVRSKRRTFRAYHISELGKLILDRIEVGFPGLWL